MLSPCSETVTKGTKRPTNGIDRGRHRADTLLTPNATQRSKQMDKIKLIFAAIVVIWGLAPVLNLFLGA